MRKHWHIASGLSGYGPDGADGFTSAYNPEQVADAIREELDLWADYEHEISTLAAQTGNYETAWKTQQHAQELETIRANLNNDRAYAPLYRDNRPLWHNTILHTVADRFPLPVNDGLSQVYVWECTIANCDHVNNYEPTVTTFFDIHVWMSTGRVMFINSEYPQEPIVTTVQVDRTGTDDSSVWTVACAIAKYADPPATHYIEHMPNGTMVSVDVTNFSRTPVTS